MTQSTFAAGAPERQGDVTSTGTEASRVVIETERLILRRLDLDDAPFIFELVNDPDWLRHIGDKGVRSLEDARSYLSTGPLAMYAQHGFGLYAVALREDGTLIGMCGPIKRDSMQDVDIGFAYLPTYRARGLAREAAVATLDYAKNALNLRRVVALVSPANHASARLCERIGLRFEYALRGADHDDPVDLFSIDFA